MIGDRAGVGKLFASVKEFRGQPFPFCICRPAVSHAKNDLAPFSVLLEHFGKHRYIYELILARDGAAVPELKRHIEEEKERAAAVLGTFGG